MTKCSDLADGIYLVRHTHTGPLAPERPAAIDQNDKAQTFDKSALTLLMEYTQSAIIELIDILLVASTQRARSRTKTKNKNKETKIHTDTKRHTKSATTEYVGLSTLTTIQTTKQQKHKFQAWRQEQEREKTQL
jgi:hypothetical protein